MRFTVRDITFSATVAAIYAALTIVLAPISFGVVQFRVSEALCMLPFFCPQAVWGLFVGCIVSNIVGGMGMLDVIFGSLATLLAAFCTAKIRKKPLAVLPPVIFNGLIVGAVLTLGLEGGFTMRTYAATALWVGVEEALVMYILALPLMYILPKWPFFSKLMKKNRSGEIAKQ